MNNLVDVLDATRQLFSDITKTKCAVCIQTMGHTSGEIEKAFVYTLQRDTDSAKTRKIGPKRPIARNSLNLRIFRDGEQRIVINNIASEIDQGRVITSSSAVGRLYNAAFIIAIPSIPGVETNDYDPVSTLCIDNYEGFDNETLDQLILVAEELSFRISAMLYRLHMLDLELARYSRKNIK